jgi:hypothetical protein
MSAMAFTRGQFSIYLSKLRGHAASARGTSNMTVALQQLTDAITANTNAVNGLVAALSKVASTGTPDSALTPLISQVEESTAALSAATAALDPETQAMSASA